MLMIEFFRSKSVSIDTIWTPQKQTWHMAADEDIIWERPDELSSDKRNESFAKRKSLERLYPSNFGQIDGRRRLSEVGICHGTFIHFDYSDLTSTSSTTSADTIDSDSEFNVNRKISASED